MDNLKFATLVALTMLVCGCMSGTADETTTTQPAAGGDEPTATTAAATPTTVKAATTLKATVTTQAAGGGILSDLKAALSSGVGYQCTYTYQDVQSMTKMKGQKFSSRTTVEGQVSNAISDGTWMYTWMDGQAQGIKFNIADMKNNAPTPGQQKAPSMDDIASSANNVQCTPSAVSDSEFNPPSGVEFQDMGEFLKQLQGMRVGN